MVIKNNNKNILVYGVFDLLHKGHVIFLKKSRELGISLTVAVQSDESVFRQKGYYPAYNQKDRCYLLESLKYVDKTYIYDHTDYYELYTENYRNNDNRYLREINFYEIHDKIIATCVDYIERDFVKDFLSKGYNVVFFPYTHEISTTKTKEKIRSSENKKSDIPLMLSSIPEELKEEQVKNLNNLILNVEKIAEKCSIKDVKEKTNQNELQEVNKTNLVFENNRTDLVKTWENIWDNVATEDSLDYYTKNSKVRNEENTRELIDYLVRFFDIENTLKRESVNLENVSWIDFGCGTGSISDYLLRFIEDLQKKEEIGKYTPLEVFLIDKSENMLRIAKDRNESHEISEKIVIYYYNILNDLGGERHYSFFMGLSVLRYLSSEFDVIQVLVRAKKISNMVLFSGIYLEEDKEEIQQIREAKGYKMFPEPLFLRSNLFEEYDYQLALDDLPAYNNKDFPVYKAYIIKKEQKNK